MIELGETGLTCDVPRGLRDATYYVYRAPPAGSAVRDELAVDESPSEPGMTAQRVVDEKARDLESIFDDRLSKGAASDVTVDNTAAVQMNLRVRIDGGVINAWLLGIVKDGWTTQVHFMGNNDAAETAQLREGLSLRGAPPSPPTPAGFTRRKALRLALDVPSRLKPPTVYVFETPDEKTRLEARCVAADDPDAALSAEQLLKADAGPEGKVTASTKSKLSVADAPGEAVAAAIERPSAVGPQTQRVRWAAVKLDDRWRLHMRGVAPAAQARTLDAAWEQWIGTIRRKPRA